MRKFPVIFLFVLILVSTGVFASSTWEDFQNGDDNLGRADTTFTNNFESSNVTTANYAGGDAFQNIIADIDNDGKNEIITSNGNYLQILSVSGQTIFLENELFMNATQDSVGWTGNIDSDERLEYVVSFGDIIYTIDYNGSNFNKTISGSVLGNTTEGGISCAQFSGVWGCYAGSKDGFMLEYNPLTGGISSYSLGADFDCANCPYHAPFIFDIDNDGKKEMGFIGKEEFNVIEQTGPTVEWTYTPTTGNWYNMRGALVYNLDGAGDTETCITYTQETGINNYAAYLACFNGDGSKINETRVYEDTSGPGINFVSASNPVIVNVEDVGDPEICMAIGNHNSVATKTRAVAVCYSIGAVLIEHSRYSVQEIASYFPNTAWDNTTVVPITVSGKLKDTNKESMFVGDSFFYYDGANLLRDNTTGAFGKHTSSIGDTNDNGFIEIVQSSLSNTFVYFTSKTNNPPQINNSQLYGGYGANFDFTNPICKDTTVTFTAQECGGSASCNYNNDAPADIETLRSNCGTQSFSENLDNGSSDLASPTFSCFFNTTGSRLIRIYMEDNKNAGDLTQFNSQNIIVNVIDGVLGSTCNFAGFASGTKAAPIADPSATQVDQSIEATIGILTGTSPTLKFIIGLSLVIGVVMTAAINVPAIAASPLLMIPIATFALGIVTLLGLIPFWVMILMFVGLALIAVFSNVIIGKIVG